MDTIEKGQKLTNILKQKGAEMKSKIRKAMINTLSKIEKDMEKDIIELGTKPLNGQTLAEMFGKQGAAITALATLMKVFLQTSRKRGDE